MSRLAFIGTWEITKCDTIRGSSPPESFDIDYLRGVQFRLDENGDVTWFVHEDDEAEEYLPLFNCETYEIYIHSGKSGVVLRFGAYGGQVLEFVPDKPRPTNSVIFAFEKVFLLYCTRRKDESEDDSRSPYFTLLPALEDGYFSDITITASNNKQFKVHSTILELQGDGIDWNSDPPPFSNIPEDVLGTILHFLYAEYIPENLTEDTARQVITFASPYPSLKKLVTGCQLYINNTTLKQQVISLVNDMHSCLNQIIERFQPRSNQSSSENLISNPDKLCFVVKQCIRDAAVVFVKLLMLCDLFTQRGRELSRNERHEIVRYAKSRIPLFVSQISRFLQCLKDTFNSITPAQRIEIATFLVPEIEVILDTLSKLIASVENVLQKIKKVYSHDYKRNPVTIAMFPKVLSALLYSKEMAKLKIFQDHLTCSLQLLVRKKEYFNEMSSSQRVRSIARNLEQLIEELPIFLIRLQETASVFDDKLEWRDFKFCFKVATSRVSSIIEKLVAKVDLLQNEMQQISDLIQRDAFTQTLQALGLLSVTAESRPRDWCASSSHTNETPNMTTSSSFSKLYSRCPSYKLSLVKFLCTPPKAKDSKLARLCLELLKSKKKTDMEFEIVEGTFNAEQDAEEGAAHLEKCIKSHRVIVAARCDWFRRALLSGMREAIDKKIVIHDTSPPAFHCFLEYLYSGKVGSKYGPPLPMEQYVELLLLSDKYELDCLKGICENILLYHVDVEYAFYLLIMSDQYNASLLKTRCLNYIADHHELTETEEFFELPISLQAQIFDSVWTQPTGAHSSLENLLPTSSASGNPGVNDLRNASELDPNHSNSSSFEDLTLKTSSRMNSAIAHLRDILGDTVSREELVQVILEADYNLGRAVNYYYAKSGLDE